MSAETRKGPPTRGLTLKRPSCSEREKIDEETRTVELAFSSEAPYARWWGIEILDHSRLPSTFGPPKVRRPLLCDHDSRDQIGVIESVRIDADRVGRAVVRFGKARGQRRFSATWWMASVERVGRWRHRLTTLFSKPKSPAMTKLTASPAGPLRSILVSWPTSPSASPPLPILFRRSRCPLSKPRPLRSMSPRSRPSPYRRAEARRRNHRHRRTVRLNQGMAAEALRSGEPVDAFRSRSWKSWPRARCRTQPPKSAALSGGEKQRCSVLRALRALVDKKTGANADSSAKCHQAILKRAGIVEAPNNGFYVPYEIQQRDLTATTGNAGGYVVATDNLAGSFIDLLRNRAVVAQLGATMMTGLSATTVTIPKQTAAATAYWLTNEATAITESQMTLGQLAPVAPKNVGVYTELSRQLMLQSSPAADAWS